MRKNRPRLWRRDAAIAYLAPGFAGLRDEMLCVAYLDAGLRIAGTRRIYARGGVAVEVPLRRIVEDAIALGCDGMILAHNHPSGIARPSEADLAATRALAGIVGPLGIRLRDHLVFGGADCFSFRADGLL